MKINATKLTPEAFTGFGQVLMGPGGGPERYEFAARIENLRENARANTSFMRVAPAIKPIQVTQLERHAYSNQTFVPMNGTYHLVAVCPSDAAGHPVVEKIAVFVAGPSQAVNYNAGCWHAPRTVIKGAGEFVMFRWDDGSDLDTELVTLDAPVTIQIDAEVLR